MNGQPPQSFSDFDSPVAFDEGPVSTPNIERKRHHKRRQPHDKMKRAQRKRRGKRAS